VKLVTERIRKDEQEQNCLDLQCQDLGWSPLHYAAVAGWNDVVELLLAGGCDLRSPSDPTLMCLLRYVW
jgi:ankyrin repeat protein